MNPFPSYLHSQLEDKLKNHRVVVWYDAAREFEPFVAALARDEDGELPSVTLGTTETRLAVFQGSYFALRLQVEPLVSVNRPQPLLIYLPGERRDPKGSVLMELEKAGKRHFLEVSADVIEQVDAAFYGDIRTALMKGLEMA